MGTGAAIKKEGLFLSLCFQYNAGLSQRQVGTPHTTVVPIGTIGTLRYLQYLQRFFGNPGDRTSTGLSGIFTLFVCIKRLPPTYKKIAPYVSKDCPPPSSNSTKNYPEFHVQKITQYTPKQPLFVLKITLQAPCKPKNYHILSEKCRPAAQKFLAFSGNSVTQCLKNGLVKPKIEFLCIKRLPPIYFSQNEI